MIDKIKTWLKSNTAMVLIAAVLAVVAQMFLPEFAPLPYKLALAMITLGVLNQLDERLWKDISIIEELRNENTAIAIVVGSFIIGMFLLLAGA